MNISVVVICLNEENNIRGCLQSLCSQDYPAEQMEIIVVDGGSVDKTCQIVREFSAGLPRTKLVIELKRGAAAARNAGIKAADHEMIAFTDADCEVPGDWLSRLAGTFRQESSRDSRTAGVGGGNIPPENTSRFTQAVGIALNSYLGSFSSIQGRQFQEHLEVVSLATLNVLYSKRVLEKLNGYDESLVSEAEDAELNYRLRAANYRLVFIPDLFVWHKMRPTARGWLRNMFRYGRGRARLLKRYPAMWALDYVFSMLFLPTVFLVVLAPVLKIFLLPLLYFPLVGMLSGYKCLQNKRLYLSFDVFLVYLIQHFGYSAGMIFGLVSSKVK